jgi:HPt (histidine-containing phosphotransfer) domain-containing protein
MKTNKLYDLTQLIDIVGDEEGLQKMVTIFVESTPRIMDDLNENLLTNNFEMIAHNAHKMKASIDMMKIVSLHDVIRKIDKPEKVLENKTDLKEIVGFIKITLDSVFADLKKEFSL